MIPNKKAMTLEEFYRIEQELQASGQNNKEYLNAKGINPYQYYYWKRKAREQSAGSLPRGGSFLPIQIPGSGLSGKGERNKNTSSAYISQGEMEIEIRTAGGAELRIRGFLDPVMVNTIIVSAEGRGHV